MWRLIIGALLVIVALSSSGPVDAQTNLLINPGMEGDYAGTPMRATPGGWQAWVGAGNPDFYPEVYGSVFSGGRSQALLTGSSTFTAGIYQVVNGIPTGSPVRASAWAHLSVAIGDNLAGTYSHMKVGIDPNGGTNPNDGDVVWSSTMSSQGPATVQGGRLWTEYNLLSVETVATGSSVTVFLWGSQNWAAVEHRQYWDEASLIIVGDTSGPVVAPPSAPTGRVLESRVGLNVRTGPGLGYERIGIIYPGTSYTMVSDHSGWYGIDYNGGTGYVSAAFVNVVLGQQPSPSSGGEPTVAAPPTGVTFSSIFDLNLRAGPTRTAAKLGVIPGSTPVAVIGRNDSNSWVQVNFNGQVGWTAWWFGTLSGGNYWDVPITG